MAFKDPKVGEKTQFTPGVSGNPNGMPKGTKHINTWINDLLNDEKFTAKIQEGYKIVEYKGAPIRAIISAQIRLATNGDTKAADLLFKHGAPSKLEIDLTSNGETVAQPLDMDMVTQFMMMAKDQTKQ